MFQGDTTYYISSSVNLYGTTVVEGGTVIKFNSGGLSGPDLTFNGPVDCQTSHWHPAIFTAKDDDSVGGSIIGSSGSPSGNFYGRNTIACKDTSETYQWHDIRIRYGYYGIVMFGGVTAEVSHAQIGFCARSTAAYPSTTQYFGNVLLHDGAYGLWNLLGPTYKCEQTTFHLFEYLTSNTNATLPCLTNTLVIAVTNNVLYTGGSDVVATNDDTGIFQTVSKGSRYLEISSSYRDSGTTNIQSALLKELRELTTYPPYLLTNTLSGDLTLSLQAIRDKNTPDLGYHYDPLDYVAQGLMLTNALLKITNGAAIGIDFEGVNYGINLDSGAMLVSLGLADRPNRFVMVHSVQEELMDYDIDYTILAETQGATVPTSVQFTFTEIPMISQSYLINDISGLGTMELLSFRHSILKSGNLVSSSGVSNALISMTNNCLVRFLIYTAPTNTGNAWFQNNLFKDGLMAIEGDNTSYNIYNNFYHDTILFQFVSGAPQHDYNAYITNANNWGSYAANDVLLTNRPVFLEGPLGGNYYYPTNDGMLSKLIDMGSTNADVMGLFHFTTTTNQFKETNSIVDIGFHHIALNGADEPVDTDNDGIPDYLEDINGNGSLNSGESDWEDGDDPGLSVTIVRPRNDSVVP